METKDLYKVLGLKREASREEIRSAYRKLARKHHPDANSGDPESEARFKEIQHAYEILANPEKKREYDEGPRAYFGGDGGRDGGERGGFGGFSDIFEGFGNLGDVLGRSGAGSGSQRRKGEDVTVSVNLKFKDALEGVTTRVGATVEETCGDCAGSGAAPGTSIKRCPDCGGRGVRSRDQGFFALSEPCSRCGGEGTFVESPCSKCSGGGKVKKSQQVTVRIPAGAKDGMRVRVPGRGSAGKSGSPSGDLYVLTRVEEHPLFERRGDDFVVEVPISFVEAALGAEIKIPKPDGETVRLKLPAGTQDGRRFRVRGAGSPSTKKGAEGGGDLIVRASLVVPKKLRRREREILEALADERDEDVREELFKKAGAS